MSEWVWILIIAPPAVWRLTSILYQEKIAQPIRELLGVRHDRLGNVESYPATWYGYLIGCTLCLSVWVSLLFAIWVFVFPYVLLPFFLSAVSIMIQRINDKCLT